jgi:hypothetical protein
MQLDPAAVVETVERLERRGPELPRGGDAGAART